LRDGAVRTAIKRVGIGIYDLRLALHRAGARARGAIRYDLGGACIACAKCCEAPGIQVGFLTWHLPLFRRVFLLWHRHVNGFELIEARRAERAFIFRCTHFDTRTRRCDSYHSRPGMCRDYPRVLLEQANPELFDGCGFKALTKARMSLLASLEKLHLDEAQMKKLKKGLYLDEE
jgi:uncharacterized protein